MDIDINTNPNLKSKLLGLLDKHFGGQENLEDFGIFYDAEGLICLVRSDEGYIFGFSGKNDPQEKPNPGERPTFDYVLDKQALMYRNGFMTYDFFGDDENSVWGFAFKNGVKILES